MMPPKLLLMIDAARGASAARTTVVLPHYAYARSDKKDAPRISIGGRLVAERGVGLDVVLELDDLVRLQITAGEGGDGDRNGLQVFGLLFGRDDHDFDLAVGWYRQCRGH